MCVAAICTCFGRPRFEQNLDMKSPVVIRSTLVSRAFKMSLKHRPISFFEILDTAHISKQREKMNLSLTAFSPPKYADLILYALTPQSRPMWWWLPPPNKLHTYKLQKSLKSVQIFHEKLINRGCLVREIWYSMPELYPSSGKGCTYLLQSCWFKFSWKSPQCPQIKQYLKFHWQSEWPSGANF